ncbi:MAG: MarC family protein [Bacteroidia bacterium]|nr:MarC family protein [Bacteroidia bacterium]
MNFINLKEITTVTMILFAVIDVIGSIPVLIDLKQRIGEIKAEKASVASLIIMLVFLFVGNSFLQLIGLDVSSFAIAGSFVLFFIALEMILGIRLYKDSVPKTASIVPIAFPLIAGAGTMTTLLSLRAQYHDINIVIAIVINIALVYLVLKNTGRIAALIGDGGVDIIRKIFGVILLAIAVKLFKTNVFTGL